MSDKEQINVLIDKYIDLQRIKKYKDAELEYQMRTTKAKLEACGILTEDLEIKD